MTDHAAPRRGRLRERTAEEIRVILARRRMSAAELARRTGMKQPYVSRRMTGEIAFDLDDLEVIAATLGVTVQELLGGNGPEASQTTVPNLPIDDRRPGQAKRSMPERPKDNRPTGRAARSAPTPATRRPVRI